MGGVGRVSLPAPLSLGGRVQPGEGAWRARGVSASTPRKRWLFRAGGREGGSRVRSRETARRSGLPSRPLRRNSFLYFFYTLKCPLCPQRPLRCKPCLFLRAYRGRFARTAGATSCRDAPGHMRAGAGAERDLGASPSHRWSTKARFPLHKTRAMAARNEPL